MACERRKKLQCGHLKEHGSRYKVHAGIEKYLLSKISSNVTELQTRSLSGGLIQYSHQPLITASCLNLVR